MGKQLFYTLRPFLMRHLNEFLNMRKLKMMHHKAMARTPGTLVPVGIGTPLCGKKMVLTGCSSARVSLWDSLMFGRLAMGFANVRAGTRVLMLVLLQAWEAVRYTGDGYGRERALLLCKLPKKSDFP